MPAISYFLLLLISVKFAQGGSYENLQEYVHFQTQLTDVKDSENEDNTQVSFKYLFYLFAY